MASLCSKCGVETPAGAQACTACGTAAATPAAAHVQPAAPQPQSGSNAVKIILIVVAVFVGLSIVGAGAFGFFVWRIAHAVHVSGSGNQVTLSTPGGSFSANTADNISASELGTDIYPGAQPGKGSIRMTLPTGTMVSAVYVTSDSKDQVLSFYKSKFGSEVSIFDAPTGSVITLNKGQQESIAVTVTVNPSEYDGKTQIHIVHTTSIKSS